MTTSSKEARASPSSLSPNQLFSPLRRLRTRLPVSRRWKGFCVQSRRRDERKRRKMPADCSKKLKSETPTFKILNRHQQMR